MKMLLILFPMMFFSLKIFSLEADFIQQWEGLIDEPGCLISSIDVRYTTEGSIFQKQKWIQLLNDAKKERKNFQSILAKFDSIRPTKIHICNWENATEGLLAVFVAQQITKMNWDAYHGEDEHILKAAKENAVPKFRILKKILNENSTNHELQLFFLKRWDELYFGTKMK